MPASVQLTFFISYSLGSGSTHSGWSSQPIKSQPRQSSQARPEAASQVTLDSVILMINTTHHNTPSFPDLHQRRRARAAALSENSPQLQWACAFPSWPTGSLLIGPYSTPHLDKCTQPIRTVLSSVCETTEYSQSVWLSAGSQLCSGAWLPDTLLGRKTEGFNRPLIREERGERTQLLVLRMVRNRLL